MLLTHPFPGGFHGDLHDIHTRIPYTSSLVIYLNPPLRSDQDEPTYVDALRGVGVSQIACGSGHTVVLTTDGEVYSESRYMIRLAWLLASLYRRFLIYCTCRPLNKSKRSLSPLSIHMKSLGTRRRWTSWPRRQWLEVRPADCPVFIRTNYCSGNVRIVPHGGCGVKR
mmetsp:Transcript_36129/g.73384  ORF Transcript_36129/g.73384 Transcript_36129/m.73384 type:complete len:168 (+) Transcript_36129:658-1161(+)